VFDQQTSEAIKEAALLISQARSTVALTGAGISTPSGIPDFRSPESGMWDNVNPMEVASIQGFQRDPGAFYGWVRPLVTITAEAEPNPAHLALAQLERIGKLDAIITQNIDILHSKAGSKTIYEVHGHLRDLACLHCGVEQPAAEAMMRLAQTGEMPICIACEAIVKPKVILFGELLPAAVLNSAERSTLRADLFIVIGSSLEVAPVNSLPRMAKQRGAKLIIINFGETHMDPAADIIIRGDVAHVLPDIVQQVTALT